MSTVDEAERTLQICGCSDTYRGGPAIRISVHDCGVGLDARQMERLFAFYTTKPHGMGLGLAICRSIVAAHGGTLSAARRTDFGTTFTVGLPLPTDGPP